VLKLEATPDVLIKIRAFADRYESHPPALLAAFGNEFPFSADSDRGLGILLLATAVHQPGGGEVFGDNTARLMTGLYRHYGNEIFKLNRLPFEPLRMQVEELSTIQDAADRARIPGIVRSVCDFFYRIGPLSAWLADAPDWEQRAGELSAEIYWMGARSATRTKARLFFWMICQVPEFCARPEMHAHALRFAWPVGDGHMRFVFDILKPPRAAKGGSSIMPALRSAARRGEVFAEFSRLLFPSAPWRGYMPLDSFLKPDGRGGFRCRTVQGGCDQCPLYALCPAAR
jgi:hypothetical protein